MAKKKSKLPKAPKKRKSDDDITSMSLGKEKAAVLENVPLPPRVAKNSIAEKYPDEYQMVKNLKLSGCVIFDKSKTKIFQSIKTKLSKDLNRDYQYRPISADRGGVWYMKDVRQKRKKKGDAEE